jgi:hypothetical protein
LELPGSGPGLTSKLAGGAAGYDRLVRAVATGMSFVDLRCDWPEAGGREQPIRGSQLFF